MGGRTHTKTSNNEYTQFAPEIEGRTPSIEFDNIECMGCVVIRSIYQSN